MEYCPCQHTFIECFRHSFCVRGIRISEVHGRYDKVKGGIMKLPEEGLLLRVFIGETDQYKGKALYEQIVLKARELNLAGATVLRGIMGFGADSRLHTAKILELSQDLPVVVEIVDTEEQIKKIL